MPKNIIVCADGTGNKGGTTPDSNVYRVYKSVNKSFTGKAQDGFDVDEQILFYDNGIGTQKNKFIRALGGALGFGFEDNVCDLYRFLARHYEPGDRIYFFGFSRGASTVRACNGFIGICGLCKGKGLGDGELAQRVKEAFSAYKVHKKKPEVASALKHSERSHGSVDIQFIGIWDTVVALGFPKRTDVTGPFSAILNALFWLAEKGLDKIWPHSFYHYRLTDNVKHACQALAIDDERTAFWPFVWREQGRDADTVEQVWFAGMHSNVGGGYARSGMASVALHWMMLRAEKRGLAFNEDAVKMALADSHVHGRMYNSRDGFAIFYRYHPREIEKLCEGRLEGEIRLHRSVIERIKHRTANYAPGHLPGKFIVTESDLEAVPEPRNPGKDPKWAQIRNEINGWVLRRKGLHMTLLTLTLALVVTAFRLNDPSQTVNREGFWGGVANLLDFVLPDLLDRLIDVAVVQHYYLFIGAVLMVFAYFSIRRWFFIQNREACERLRHLIIHEKDAETVQMGVEKETFFTCNEPPHPFPPTIPPS